MITATVQGADAVDRRLARLPTVTARALRQELTASLLLLEADAKQHVAQDTRALARSITHTIDGTGVDLTGRVGPGLGYGVVVERGRRTDAKMPPVAALIPWVQRHGLAGPGRGKASRTQARRVAFLIARKIARKGIPAHPYLATALERQLPIIRARFARLGVEIVASLRGGA